MPHFFRLLCAISLLSFIALFNAHADVYLVRSGHGPMLTGEITYWVSESGIRMDIAADEAPTTSVINLQKKISWRAVHWKKEVFVSPMKDAPAGTKTLKQVLAQPSAKTLKSQGKTKSIAGHICTLTDLLIQGQPHSTLCLIEVEKLGMSSAKWLAIEEKTMSFADPNFLMIREIDPNTKKVQIVLETNVGNSSYLFRDSIIEASSKSFGPAPFNVPAGYKIVDKWEPRFKSEDSLKALTDAQKKKIDVNNADVDKWIEEKYSQVVNGKQALKQYFSDYQNFIDLREDGDQAKAAFKKFNESIQCLHKTFTEYQLPRVDTISNQQMTLSQSMEINRAMNKLSALVDMDPVKKPCRFEK